MRKLFIVLVLLFVLFCCTENTEKGSGGSSDLSTSPTNQEDSTDIENIDGKDYTVVCNEELQVIPMVEPIAMKLLKNISFGRKLYAVYPAAVDPEVALYDWKYVGRFYSQNSHDYISSVRYQEKETFDVVSAMAGKGVIVAPQIMAAKFRVTLTHYSENSNSLRVFVRAKGSSDDWKIIILSTVGQTAYVFVETNELGELEFYFEENSHYDWIDDEFAEPGYHYYGFVEATCEIERTYLPFK